MSIITRYLHKIKLFITDHEEEVGVSIIIVLVGISSYSLGRYSVISTTKEPTGITFENKEVEVTDASPKTVELTPKGDSAEKSVEGQVVASKNGTKYYLPWCGSAERILAKNKVFFASALEAEKAGFTKAANCKGM